MSKRIKIEEEYSIAMFEDGTTEMIPKAWIEDYLPPEDVRVSKDTDLKEESNEDYDEVIYTPLRPVKTINYDGGNEEINGTSSSSAREEDDKKILEQNKILLGVVKDLNETKEIVKKIQKHVDRLVCNLVKDSDSEVNFLHPAETLDQFLALEQHIKNKENYEDMVVNLSKIGGRTIEMATRKIWNKICSSKLASKICWTGANGKHCLKRMLLNRLVRDSVLITHPQGREFEIQRATMLWFSHAKDRLRSRKLL